MTNITALITKKIEGLSLALVLLSCEIAFAGNGIPPAGSATIRQRVEGLAWVTTSNVQLRSFRGAISTVRLNLPYGPRPGRDDNVLFTPTYLVYDAGNRARMREAYRSRGYTHWAIGPIGRAKPMYHNQYPSAPFDSIAEPDKFADLLEELWRDGEIPVYFALPDTPDFMTGDGWNWDAVERELTPIYSSPRWQALVRVAVLAWEPDIPAAEWRRGVKWLVRVFPNALRYVHLPADQLSPCRRSELAGKGASILSEGQCWQQVAPYIYGVLFQSGAMGQRGANESNPPPIERFLNGLLKIVHQARDGSARWPIKSAKPSQPLDIVTLEYASYWNYWQNVPEAEARSWGDAAMGRDSSRHDNVGRLETKLRGKLAGSGDGGTVATLPVGNPATQSNVNLESPMDP